MLAVFFCFLFLRPSAWAENAQEDRTILRVGFFAFDGYHNQDQEERRSGYGYEFLQHLASHAGWTYQYVGYEKSYAEELTMLENGEIDILTSVSKTAEREEKFLFSDQNIGTNSTIFTVKAGNTAVVEGDYSSYNGLTIGMLEGNSKNANFERFADEHGFTYTPVYYEVQEELNAALQSGAVDGVVSGSLRVLENEWLMESFDAAPFYICCRKDQPELMRQINEAINQMDLMEPDWRNDLHDRYYATDQGGNVVVNSRERQFIEGIRGNKTPLKVLVNPDCEPYSYYEDGAMQGILPDIFTRMAQYYELPYEFMDVQSREEYFTIRQSGQADIVLDYVNDYNLAENEGYKISYAYFDTNFARLTRSDQKGELTTVAIIRPSDVLSRYAAGRYDPENILYFDTAAECVEAVRDGRADSTVMYSYMAERYILEDEKNSLQSTLLGKTSLSYAVSADMPEGYVLLSLLNKGVSAMSENEISVITLQAVDKIRQDRNLSFTAFLYSNPMYVLLIAAFVLLLLFAVAMLVVRTRNQRRLKVRVEEATKQLEEQKEELSLALQAADAASRSKTAFLNNMSHDIRTPMNAIIGFTALATAHLDNRERALDYLTKISQASNHLLSLINDVLDMSRIESGKVTIEERPENLADILQALRNIIQSDIHAKRLDLFIDTVDVTNEEVYCDKLRLNQVLLNLTGNAIKFTDVGGAVSIRVTQKQTEDPSVGLYEFCVIDNGIGMSPEFIKTIFEPFTREHTATVNGIQGTGLGMAITKNIVDMMGGTIRVSSEQGKGSEFTVELKLRYASAQQEIGVIGQLNNLRGLVVDDDMVCCQSVSKMLRQIGMRAEWTMSGKEAVVRAVEAVEMGDSFEVYIVDWAMPEMNGVETVRQIRKAVGSDSPIILMSAYDWSDIEQEAREAGVTGFISKPLFASDLHRTLQRSLGQPNKVDETPAPSKNAAFIGKRLLLAEDNELNQEIAEELLSEAGFILECAPNGKVACEMVERSKPGYYDLILMDIQMPVMDGYEAARTIREMDDPLLASIPIIAMTANAFEEDRENAIRAGMNGHIAKPVDVEKMMSVLNDLFSKHEISL